MKPVNRDKLPPFFTGFADVELRNIATMLHTVAMDTHVARLDLYDEMRRLQGELVQNSKRLEAYRRYLGAELKRRGVAPNQRVLTQHRDHVAHYTKLHGSLLDQVWAAQQRYAFFVATYREMR